MEKPDHQVHTGCELRGTERPSFFEDQIVNILQPDAGDFPEHIDGIEHLLQIYEPNFDGTILRLHHAAERVGGRPVPASRVEKDEIELFHQFDCAMRRKLWYVKHPHLQMFFRVVTRL